MRVRRAIRYLAASCRFFSNFLVAPRMVVTGRDDVVVEVQRLGETFKLDVIESVLKETRKILYPFYSIDANQESENMLFTIKSVKVSE